MLADLARAGLLWTGAQHEALRRPAHPKVLRAAGKTAIAITIDVQRYALPAEVPRCVLVVLAGELAYAYSDPYAPDQQRHLRDQVEAHQGGYCGCR